MERPCSVLAGAAGPQGDAVNHQGCGEATSVSVFVHDGDHDLDVLVRKHFRSKKKDFQSRHNVHRPTSVYLHRPCGIIGSVRTHVEVVGHAVSVKIVQTSVLIAVGGPSIFIGTRVNGIVNTVAIPVVRASVLVRIDRTPRLVNTCVHVVHDAVLVQVLRARSGPLNTHHGEGETDAVPICSQVTLEVAGHHMACDHFNGDRRDVVQRTAVDADATEGLVRPIRRSNRCAQHRRTSKINARGGRATVVKVNVHHEVVDGLSSNGGIG